MTMATADTESRSAKYGPQTEHVVALIEQLERLTPTQALQIATRPAWDAAWSAAWDAAAAAAVRDAVLAAAWDAGVAATRGPAWDAAKAATWAAPWDAAWDAAWHDAWHVAWKAAWDAAWDAARALITRAFIDPEHYDTLTMPLRRVGIVVHPDDDDPRAPRDGGPQ